MAALRILILISCCFSSTANASADPQTIAYHGDGSDLQATIDRAPSGSIIACDPKRQMEISCADQDHEGNHASRNQRCPTSRIE